MAALNLQGFRQVDEDLFIYVNTPSPWFQKFVTDANTITDLNAEPKPLHLGEIFPYIDNFLIDARSIWHQRGNASIVSSIWTEVDQDEEEVQLQARAFHADDENYLLIENISEHFAEKHRIYQHMRELALVNENLIVNLNHRQRSLQNEILRLIKSKGSVDDLSERYSKHPAGVMICRRDGKVEVSNNALINIYQMTTQGSLAQESVLDQWMREAEALYPEMRRVVETGHYWDGSFESASGDGDKRWIQLSIAPVLADDLSIEHYVCIAYDLSEYKRAEEKIESIVEYDFTTKLPNRRFFWRMLEEKLATTQAREESLSLLSIDIDYFKQVNDEFGHVAADKALVTIANRLGASLKNRDFVAHLGGDEFAVIVELDIEKTETGNIAERLLAAIAEPMVINDTLIKIHCSIGIGVCHASCAVDAHELFKQADLALYYAKQSGRNRIQLYHDGLERHSQRLKREQELRVAFLQQQYELFYQPQIAIGASGTVKLEALLRWKHPNGSCRFPDEFIELLESSGLIVPIGEWVLRQACRHASEMLKNKLDIKVSINISAKQLAQTRFFDDLKDLLVQEALPPDRIELEITEHCLVDESGAVVNLLRRIRELGVIVAIDDFGAGYSSLSYLKNLPVDVLKIDRSFVTELPENPESRAITKSILQLAHALRLEVVAEGVESAAQLAFLEENHCDYAQGFLFSPAVPVDEVPNMLERTSLLYKTP